MPDGPRIAFLGIGHPLRRDDAAGVEVCERLRPALAGRRDALVVAGGSAPENCVGALRAFGPDRIVVIDAARMGETPGTLLRIQPSDPRAAGASTHTLPLPVFCHYLQETLSCDVVLLGIEPADTSFGEGLTPAVQEAVEQAAHAALKSLNACQKTCTFDPPELSLASPPPPASQEFRGHRLIQGEGKGWGFGEGLASMAAQGRVP